MSFEKLRQRSIQDIIESGDVELGIFLMVEELGWQNVVKGGATKYAPNGWLEPDGKSSDLGNMIRSINGHCVKHMQAVMTGQNPIDDEFGCLHLEHAICRLFMLLVRYKYGIVHKLDREENIDE